MARREPRTPTGPRKASAQSRPADARQLGREVLAKRIEEVLAKCRDEHVSIFGVPLEKPSAGPFGLGPVSHGGEQALDEDEKKARRLIGKLTALLAEGEAAARAFNKEASRYPGATGLVSGLASIRKPGCEWWSRWLAVQRREPLSARLFGHGEAFRLPEREGRSPFVRRELGVEAAIFVLDHGRPPTHSELREMVSVRGLAVRSLLLTEAWRSTIRPSMTAEAVITAESKAVRAAMMRLLSRVVADAAEVSRRRA